MGADIYNVEGVLLRSLFSLFRASSEMSSEVPVLKADYDGLRGLAENVPAPYVSDDIQEGKDTGYVLSPFLSKEGQSSHFSMSADRFHHGEIWQSFKDVEGCLPELQDLKRNPSGNVYTSSPCVTLDEEASQVVSGILKAFFEQDGWKNAKDMEGHWNKMVPVELKKIKFSGEDCEGTSPSTLYNSARSRVLLSSCGALNSATVIPFPEVSAA